MLIEHTWVRQALHDPVAALSILEEAHLGVYAPYGDALARVMDRIGDGVVQGLTPDLLWAEVTAEDRDRFTAQDTGLSWLADLQAKGPLTSEEVAYSHSRLREERARRVLSVTADLLRAKVALDNPADLLKQVFAQLEEAQRVLSGGEKEYLRGQEIADYAVGMLAEFFAAGGTWKTGIEPLDDLLGGFAPGQLIVLGAWTGHGKSLLSQAIVDGITAHNPEAGEAYFLDCEMGVPTVVSRQLQRITGQNPKYAASLEAALELLTPHLGRIAGSKTVVGAPKQLTLGAAVRHSQMAVALGCRVIVWDGGHILKVPGKDNRQQEIEEVTRRAKAFAREHNVLLILTGQLNQDRPPQNGGLLRPPEREDFKGSRSFTEDADVALLLRRVDKKPCAGDLEMYGASTPTQLAESYVGLTNVKVAKQRSGSAENETFDLRLDPRSLKYVEETTPIPF